MEERRAGGLPLLDLTRTNPTECGLRLRPDAGLDTLRDGRALEYEPDARGAVTAREAIAAYYADHGAVIGPERILLTASTSEAYSHLFHLLCDPDDEVLIAQPSYPLFAFLADLADVRLRPYPLAYDFGWWIDFASLERAITPRTRAVVVVHPNNPTGHWTSAAERLRIEELCARAGIALIVDEVFLDYGLSVEEVPKSFAAGESGALCFVLSGLSKVVALPQMKVGWIVVCGPKAPRVEALERLEIVADTFLSVNTPAQLALPAWMRDRVAVQEEIRSRLRTNVETLRAAGLEVLRVEAGWSAIVRLPQTHVEPWAERLLSHGVLVHPGSFYGMGGGHYVVLSLLTRTKDLREGARIIATVATSDLARAASR